MNPSQSTNHPRRKPLSANLCTLIVIGLLGISLGVAAAEEPTQLRVLPAANLPRFKITDQDWPAQPGEASVCLWRDDKVAAVTVTIDDNAASDQAWWLAQGQKYGFHFTWFVISGRIGSGRAFDGTWDDLAKLRAAGHDVQSHTVDHFSPQSGATTLPTDDNYRQSIEQIQSHLPGARVLTLAYPGGSNGRNDMQLAGKYYIAARGLHSVVNPANQINYLNVDCMVRAAPIDAQSSTGLPNLIDPHSKYPQAYRGWACMIFHGLENVKLVELRVKESIVTLFDYLSANKDSFWVGTFTEVAQYAEERDSATLKSAAIDGKTIRLTLTDRMDDHLFDAPLTIKIRSNTAWSKATARQADHDIPVSTIDHNGARYLLLGVVPDRGEVVVTGSPGENGKN